MDLSGFPIKCFSSSAITSVIKKGRVDLRPQCNSILNDLNNQRREGYFCDAALHCRGEIIHAHKCVLKCVSKYFETLFTTKLSTTPTSVAQVLNFEEYSPLVVGLLVDLIYMQVDIPYSLMIELLQLAIFVQYDGLVNVLVEVIRPLINDTNVLNWLEVAHHCGCEELIWLTECFVREDYAKLHWKAMLNGTKVKDKLSYVRKSKVRRETKELVYVVTEHNNEFILDVERMLLSSHHVEEGTLPACILDGNIFPSLLSCFVWDGMIFAVSSNKSHSGRIRKDGKDLVVRLLKYRHCSSKFDCMETYNFCQRSRTLQQSYFDGKKSVYLQIVNEVESHYEDVLIYKIDMNTGLLHEGHINMGCMDLPWQKKLFCFNDGVYYIGLDMDCIIKVSDFNFDQTESNTAEEITLSPMITGLEPVLSLWGLILYQSCNGTGYCVLPPETPTDEEHCILKLDVEKSCWVLVCKFRCSLVHDVICCNRTMLLVYSTAMDIDNHKVLYFDEIAEVVMETDIQMPEGYLKYFNFPNYV